MPSSPNKRNDPPSEDDQHQLRQEAIAWLARLSDREATAEDREGFERWRSQSSAHARMFERLARTWGDRILNTAALHVAQGESVLKAKHPTGSKLIRYVVACTACLAALILGGIYFDLITRLQADYQTAVGERHTVRLPDESLVTLNAHTAIATSFNERVRTVRILKGEAFFRVRHDAARPFVVESKETVTRAVGTEFVVRRRHGSDRVTVLEGIVEVTARRGTTTTQLTAGNMVETEEGRLTAGRPVDPSIASAWLNGLLIVDGAPLGEVIEELRRYHHGAIFLWNRRAADMRVTGTYKLDEPSRIVFHLTKTFPLQKLAFADRMIVLF
jgi:transmembrane sensor